MSILLSQGEITALLRSQMQANRMTQAALAKRLKVSPPFVNLVLSGQRRPTGRLLRWLGFEQVIEYRYRRKRRAPQHSEEPTA